jgi:hypothetical protein
MEWSDKPERKRKKSGRKKDEIEEDDGKYSFYVDDKETMTMIDELFICKFNSIRDTC